MSLNLDEAVPYYKIEMHIASVGDDADESVDFILYLDELCIRRDGAPEDKDKNFDMLPEVDLTFTIGDAVKLRDFLNFALPTGDKK